MGLANASNISKTMPTQAAPQNASMNIGQLLQGLMQMRQQGGFPGKGPSQVQQPQQQSQFTNPAFGRMGAPPMPGQQPQSMFQMPAPFVPQPVVQPARNPFVPTTPAAPVTAAQPTGSGYSPTMTQAEMEYQRGQP